MNMPDVWKPFNGSVSFVLLRHQTRWGLKCSTLVIGSSTLMVSTKRSGCVAINAKRLSICAVSLRRKKKISKFPSCAGSMSVGSNPKFKRVGLAIKRVIFSFTVARQKTTKKKVRRVKDGRVIAPRKTASAGRDQKEHTAKVLKASKFKWVTLTAFKWVMIRAGNRLLDNLCNPPLPLFLP